MFCASMFVVMMILCIYLPPNYELSLEQSQLIVCFPSLRDQVILSVLVYSHYSFLKFHYCSEKSGSQALELARNSLTLLRTKVPRLQVMTLIDLLTTLVPILPCDIALILCKTTQKKLKTKITKKSQNGQNKKTLAKIHFTLSHSSNYWSSIDYQFVINKKKKEENR